MCIKIQFEVKQQFLFSQNITLKIVTTEFDPLSKHTKSLNSKASSGLTKKKSKFRKSYGKFSQPNSSFFFFFSKRREGLDYYLSDGTLQIVLGNPKPFPQFLNMPRQNPNNRFRAPQFLFQFFNPLHQSNLQTLPTNSPPLPIPNPRPNHNPTHKYQNHPQNTNTITVHRRHQHILRRTTRRQTNRHNRRGKQARQLDRRKERVEVETAAAAGGVFLHGAFGFAGFQMKRVGIAGREGSEPLDSEWVVGLWNWKAGGVRSNRGFGEAE